MAVRNLIKSYPVIAALAVLGVSLVLRFALPFDSSPLGIVEGRLILWAVSAGYLAFVVGREAFVLRKVGFTFRKCIYVFVLICITSGISLVRVLDEGQFAPDWALGLAVGLAGFLSVGLFEEFLFRGVILGSLMARMGSTRKGMVGAVLISALIFGGVHCLTGITAMLTDPVGALTGVLKIIQVGLMGILFGAIYVKTRCLWGVAIIHGLYDFISSLSNLLLYGMAPNPQAGEYVATGAAGMGSALSLTIFIVLQIPFAVIGLRMLKTVDPTKQQFKRMFAN